MRKSGVVNGTQTRLYTPWGRAKHFRQLEPGVYAVRTNTNPYGVTLAQAVARRELTESARRRAQTYGRYFCYAKESAAIVAWEMDGLCEEICEGLGRPVGQTLQNFLFLVLSRHYTDYLLDVGVDPEPKSMKLWKASNCEREMQTHRHPDLIVSAMGPAQTKREGVVEVTTADGKTHDVTEGSYDALPPTALHLLSNCVKASPF